MNQLLPTLSLLTPIGAYKVREESSRLHIVMIELNFTFQKMPTNGHPMVELKQKVILLSKALKTNFWTTNKIDKRKRTFCFPCT